MASGAKRRASGIAGWLLTPFRARARITEKLGPGWAIAADSLSIGGALGLLSALILDVPGEARLGIFAGLIALAGIAGAAIAMLRKERPEHENDTRS
jgi:hypothetical protein